MINNRYILPTIEEKTSYGYKRLDPYTKLFEERIIFLGQAIDDTVANDVMVVFGRPKGRRGSYKQWQEDNIAPQVVFEILSPSNSLEEMERKLLFYQRYGVEEYYLYDPDSHNFQGWWRQEGLLSSIPEIKALFPELGEGAQFQSARLTLTAREARALTKA